MKFQERDISILTQVVFKQWTKDEPLSEEFLVEETKKLMRAINKVQKDYSEAIKKAERANEPPPFDHTIEKP